MTITGDTSTTQEVEAQTRQGTAGSVLQINGYGNVEIRAESDPATKSDIIQFVVPNENPTPTPPLPILILPTETPPPAPTLTSTPTSTITPEATPTPPVHTDVTDWIGSFFVAGIVAFLAYWLAMLLGQMRWGIRSAFLAITGGLLAYLYLALELPGGLAWINDYGFWGIISITFIGALLGVGSAWLWRLFNVRRK